MARDVLVPVDGSDPSRAALGFAIREHREGTITALHIVAPSDSVGAATMDLGGDHNTLLEAEKSRGERLLESVREQAVERGVEIETECVVGDLPRSIMEYVHGQGIDHVVIGSHGRTGIKRVVLGSIAERVVRRCPVPVTVVR